MAVKSRREIWLAKWNTYYYMHARSCPPIFLPLRKIIHYTATANHKYLNTIPPCVGVSTYVLDGGSPTAMLSAAFRMKIDICRTATMYIVQCTSDRSHQYFQNDIPYSSICRKSYRYACTAFVSIRHIVYNRIGCEQIRAHTRCFGCQACRERLHACARIRSYSRV